MATKRSACVTVHHKDGATHDDDCAPECARNPITVIDVGCTCPDAPHGECSAMVRAVEKLYAEAS